MTGDVLSSQEFKSFGPSILGLGNISEKSEYGEALAAIFDLEGFTAFCNQIDPHLVVPEFLDAFLSWLFREIADEFCSEEHEGSVFLWAHLPFFAKFMGDGVLLLWDTKHTDSDSDIGNIVVSLASICEKYRKRFIPLVRADFNRLPQRLRCGIARGQVVAVGDGADFVGSCINMAARIQKLSGLSFAFPRRGFSPKKCFSDTYIEDFIAKRVAIRGIGRSFDPSHASVIAGPCSRTTNQPTWARRTSNGKGPEMVGQWG
jgi:hypothetical protein